MGVNWRKVSVDDAFTYRQWVRDFTDNTGPTVAEYEEYITKLSYSIVCAELSLPRKRYRPFLKPYWQSGNVKELRAVNRQKRNHWICDGKPRGMQYASYREYATREFINALKRAQRQYEQE